MTDKKLNETALLNRYLKSRGINPGFVNKDQKVAHSKTNQFKVWARAHVNDDVRESITTELSPAQKRLNIIKSSINTHKEIRTTDGGKKLHSEAVDKKDTITFDIPLLIRVLEFAREELKSDILLHQMVERLISIRGKGTLTMNQYGKIVKEEVEQLDEVSADVLRSYLKQRSAGRTKSAASTIFQHKDSPVVKKHEKKEAGMARARKKLEPHNQHLMPKKAEPQPTSNKVLSTSDAIAKDYKDQEKKRGIGHVRDHVEVDVNPIQEGSAALRMAKALQKAKQERELKDQSREAREKQQTPPVKENMEPLAAVAQPCDCANSSDDTIPAKRSAKLKLLLGGKKGVTESWKYHTYSSKEEANSARNAHHSWRDENGKASGNPARLMPGNKVAYKGEFKGPKPMKEEMYDHEKEDKSTAPVGKKVKLQKPGVDAVTKEAPQAAAVLTGGKTMTGEPRDTIEIDPMMKMRKQSPNSQKSV